MASCHVTHEVSIDILFSSPDFEEWWDDSEEAGPKTRTKTDFNDPKPSLEILSVSGGKLKTPGHQLNASKHTSCLVFASGIIILYVYC